MTGDAIALDTNVAVELLNGREATICSLRPYRTLVLPATVLGELYFGAVNSGRVAENLRRVDDLRNVCQVIETGDLTARKYADTRLQLARTGRPIPENDIWIAAACVEHGLMLATRDAHFSRVAGLVLQTI